MTSDDGAGDESAEERAQRERSRCPAGRTRRRARSIPGDGHCARRRRFRAAPARAMRSAPESPTGCATSVPSPVAASALSAACAIVRRHRIAGARQLAVVTDAPVRIAQYAAGMIDEAQRLFDVALAVTRLRVIFADQPPQRRAHLLVGGGRRDSQRFVKRGSHRIRIGGHFHAVMHEYSGKSGPEASCRCKIRASAFRSGAFRETFAVRPIPPAAASCRRKQTGSRMGCPSCAALDAGRDRSLTPACPAFPGARARAFRGCAPTCRNDRAGSRASRGGHRPCA